MAFDPKRHVIKVQGGREYLPVSARLRWFREEHPDWGVVTTPVEINLEKQYAIFSATIFNEDGKVMATATKMENVKGFGDYLEKAETGSVGRALAFCGYGTQYATELDDNSVRLNEGGGGRFGARPNNGGGFANAPGNGGGQRPNGAGPGMPPRPLTAQPTQSAQPAPQYAPPAPVYEEEPFESAPPSPAVRETTMREAPREMNGNGVNGAEISDGAIAPGIMRGMNGIKTGGPKPLSSSGSDGDRPAPMAANNRPAPAGAPIARVREPEVEYADPGGDDDLPDNLADGEDPFGDDEPTTPAPAKAAPARPLARATANGVNGAAEEAPSNRCTVDGCPTMLTASQLTMSVNKYGKPICLVHQRDMVPADMAGKRPAPKAANALL